MFLVQFQDRSTIYISRNSASGQKKLKDVLSYESTSLRRHDEKTATGVE